MRDRHHGLGAALAVGCLLSGFAAAADFSREQTELRRQAESAMRDVSRLMREKKYDDAGTSWRTANEAFEQLIASGDSPELDRVTSRLRRSLSRLRDTLSRQRIDLPELKMTPPPDRAGTPDRFREEIVPILVARCAGCHIDQTCGGLSMASYETLMRGSDSGPVIAPGNSRASKLAVLVATAKMPRDAEPLRPEEIAKIVAWIDAGAAAGNPRVPLVPDDSSDSVALIAATGDESISFSRDVAPVLAERCTTCHGGRQPRARLRLETMAGVLAGGDDGAILAPGSADASPIIERITARDDSRMPADGPPLTADQIRVIQTWIAEGAHFDGPDAQMPLEELIAFDRARNMSHEQLRAERFARSGEQWRLGNPDETFAVHESGDVAVCGNLTADQLAELGAAATAAQEKVAHYFRLAAGQPVVRGGVTLFAFRRRFEYSEFVRMVENREAPATWTGHSHFDVVNAYACLVPSADPPEQLAAQLVRYLTELHLASLGPLPEWFRDGSARALAAHLEPRAAEVRTWNDQLAALVGRVKQPANVFDGSFSPEESSVLAYGLAAFLMDDARRYQGVLADVAAGTAFDGAIVERYGRSAESAAAVWLRQAAARR